MFWHQSGRKTDLWDINSGFHVGLLNPPPPKQSVHTHSLTHTHTPPQVLHTEVNSSCSNANWHSVRQRANTQGVELHSWVLSQRNTRSGQHVNSSAGVMRLQTVTAAQSPTATRSHAPITINTPKEGHLSLWINYSRSWPRFVFVMTTECNLTDNIPFTWWFNAPLKGGGMILLSEEFTRGRISFSGDRASFCRNV